MALFEGFAGELLDALREGEAAAEIQKEKLRRRSKEAVRSRRREKLSALAEKFIAPFEERLKIAVLSAAKESHRSLRVAAILRTFRSSLSESDQKLFLRVWSRVVRAAVYRLRILSLDHAGELAESKPLNRWEVSWKEFAGRYVDIANSTPSAEEPKENSTLDV